MLIAVPIVLVGALVASTALGGAHIEGASTVTLLAAALFALVNVALAYRSGPRSMRRFWAVLMVALASTACGNAVWAWYGLRGESRPPISIADAFFTGFIVFTIAAMFLFPVDPTLGSRLRGALEGIAAGLCLLLLSWVLVLNAVFDSHRPDTIQQVLPLLYPIACVIVLAIAVGILVGAETGQRTVLWVLTVSIAIFGVANSAYARALAVGDFDFGGAIDIAWVAALCGFGIAAVVSRTATGPVRPAPLLPPHASVWLPYVPFLLAGTVGPLIVMDGFESILVPFITTAVCLRQTVSAWENRRLLQTAAEQALSDPLTGLANRALFEDRLAHALMLRAQDERNRPIAVVSLDLDDFKLVNESLGHTLADHLLVAVAGRIADHTGEADTAARLEGDGFAILLERPIDETHTVVGRLVDALTEPFVIDGQDVLIRPSVGVAVASPIETELTAQQMMTRADKAMHAAKRVRSSRVHTFDSNMEVATDAELNVANPGVADVATRERDGGVTGGAARLRLLGELRTAVDRHQLTVAYQPKFDLRTKELVGVETLLRWPHPTLGLLAPDAFLSLVYQHGLMRPVTDLVVDMALDDASRWRSHGLVIPVAVNLFAPSLRDATLPDMLFSKLSKRDLPENMLTAEITEDMMLSDVAMVTQVLRRLRDGGITVAIDDFGSGYSALSYLRDLTIDEVKLDRHFIADVTTDAGAAAVVRAVINLTHELGMTVVAEGIEDQPTAMWLCEQGCDVGQGFFFGRPVSPDRIAAIARRESRVK